jgi:Protein of unknown function (DUF2846)
MLPRRDQNDEDVLEQDMLDAAARATHYWIRFFAALRMTMRWNRTLPETPSHRGNAAFTPSVQSSRSITSRKEHPMPNRIVRIATHLFAAAFLFAAIPAIATHAQDKQDAATLTRAAGCGASNVEFDVKTDKSQHPTAQPAPSKAMVYIFNSLRSSTSLNIGTVTTRVGIDGEWVGANHGDAYFYFEVDPGDHRICVQWQSAFERTHKLAAALSLSAEPGQIYYFHSIADVRTNNQPAMKLEPLDPAEAILLSANSAFSTSKPKK